MSLDVPSDLNYVGPAVELVANQFQGGLLSPRRVRFNLRTALAQALANAIPYGNGQDPRRPVGLPVQGLAGPRHRSHPPRGAGLPPPPPPPPPPPRPAPAP